MIGWVIRSQVFKISKVSNYVVKFALVYVCPQERDMLMGKQAERRDILGIVKAKFGELGQETQKSSYL